MIRTAIGSLSLALLGGAVLAAPQSRSPAAAPAVAGLPGTPAAGQRGGPGPLDRAVAATEVKIIDRYDLVVYARHRPIRVRVTTGAEGKPVAQRWRDALKGAFEFFDRDGDRFLGASEIRFIFSDVGLSDLLQRGLYTPAPQNVPTLDQLDIDGDRRVSFAEFTAYYRQSTGNVMRHLPPQGETSPNAQVTEAFFKLLDRNGDGKLTRDEVMAVESLLPTRDGDEDECLSMGELVPGLAGGDPRIRAVPVLNQPPNGPTLPANTSLVALYEADRLPGSNTQRLFTEYDKDRDNQLTPV
jgi:hypothetical protein